jgi:2-dehydro-3-deoxyphosphooctonate aldolase (KDO 8-P synthase)
MQPMKVVDIRGIKVSQDLPLVLIAGPCQIESEAHALMMAEKLKDITNRCQAPLIYKSSFDKANRSSLKSQRGIGLEEGLRILEKVRAQFDVPVLTDVHTEAQCKAVGEVVDVLQIPAFLCRQTDLLLAAGKTGKAVNVKKGQFLSPYDMRFVVEKIESTGNHNVLLCERGTFFGYNNLVNDFRSIPIMAQETGYPVIFDATHSVQSPGGKDGVSGGQREFVPILARAAVAVGVAGVFFEVHEDPDRAPSDAASMLNLKDLQGVLTKLLKIHHLNQL